MHYLSQLLKEIMKLGGDSQHPKAVLPVLEKALCMSGSYPSTHILLTIVFSSLGPVAIKFREASLSGIR